MPTAVAYCNAEIRNHPHRSSGSSTSVRNDSEQIGNHPHLRATDWKAAR
ncbi:hypothetical protein ACIG54_24575 [Streptomyces achromogenes]